MIVLGATIHDFVCGIRPCAVKLVDGRAKSGHDEVGMAPRSDQQDLSFGVTGVIVRAMVSPQFSGDSAAGFRPGRIRPPLR
jgi:hypothetical protein